MGETFSNRIRVRIRVLSPERLMNMALTQGVQLYEVRRENAREITASIDLCQWPALRGIVRTLGARFRVLSRRGPFFTWRALRPQLWLGICLVLGAAALYGFCQCVWRIDIEPRDGLDVQLLARHLSEQGVHVGMHADGQTLRDIEDQMLIDYTDYTYIALDQRGMVLRVRAVAATPKPDTGSEAACANIVASCDAVIDQIYVYKGTAMVKPGDTVVKGQVLIAGAQMRAGEASLVCASGDVIGRIWYSGEGQCPLEREILVPTGSKTVSRQFQTPWMCDIIKTDPAYPLARTQQSSVRLLDGLFLDVSLVTTCQEQLRSAPMRTSAAMAREQAVASAYEAALEKLPLGQLVRNTDVSSAQTQDGVTARVTFETTAPIGQTVYFEP